MGIIYVSLHNPNIRQDSWLKTWLLIHIYIKIYNIGVYMDLHAWYCTPTLVYGAAPAGYWGWENVFFAKQYQKMRTFHAGWQVNCVRQLRWSLLECQLTRWTGWQVGCRKKNFLNYPCRRHSPTPKRNQAFGPWLVSLFFLEEAGQYRSLFFFPPFF